MNDKLIHIGGKSYKKCEVVILPTHKQTQIAKNHKSNRFIYADKPMSDTQNNRNGYMNQHLYILSDEEAKEGEWCIDDNNYIFKMTAEFIKNNTHHNWQEYYKKIIATTDESLEIPCKVKCHDCNGKGEQIIPYEDNGETCSRCLGTGLEDNEKPLPRTSNDFIKAFVKAQGKITKVLVEYEYKGREYVDEQDGIGYDKVVLKVSPDNTITIKPLKDYSNRTCNTCSLWMGDRCDLDLTTKCCTFTGNLADKDYWDSRKKEKTSWSREEVIRFAEKYARMVQEKPIQLNAYKIIHNNKWIEENL